jgi:hypothetical protein
MYWQVGDRSGSDGKDASRASARRAEIRTAPHELEAAMKITIEFYRTREADDAHAVVGRETADVIDLDEAIHIARLLSLTLNMPQRPDAMSISDSKGNRLYSSIFLGLEGTK